MEENYEGKRVAGTGGVSPGGKKPLLIAACVVGVLCLLYLGLCAYVTAAGRILPNTEIAGVHLGNLTPAQAAARLNETAVQRYTGKSITVTAGEESFAISLDEAGVGFDADTIAQDAAGHSTGNFFTRGAVFLGSLLGGVYELSTAPLTFQNPTYVQQILETAAYRVDQPVVQHNVSVTDATLDVRRGQPGKVVDLPQLERQLREHLKQEDFSDLKAEPQVTDPEELDFQRVYDTVFREPADASLNPETYEITPSVTGVSFDIAAAQALFERTEPGETCRVPLVLTDPAVTTQQLEDTLFRDLLGEAKSKVSGTNNRAANVALAAQSCDGVILLPGDEFSYNGVVGQRTRERGYLPAPSYVNGLTVDEIGGGICQVSSSVYYAALHANLKIVERKNHSFAVGYLPDGGDATVFYGSLDFRFQNDTPYPIKIVAMMEGRSLAVQIYGTKTDTNYVKMEFIRTATTPAVTVYEQDASIPIGTTKEKITPYTGRTVEAYRCIYDENDKLVSKSKESVNYYKKRDRVILINPADAGNYGGTQTPTPSPSPSSSPGPVETAPPTVSSTPAPEVTPPVTESPLVSPTPTPGQPDPTPTPTPVPTPSETFEPIGPATGGEEQE